MEDAYQRDRDEARQAAGTPASLQGKTAIRDGVERYTAPSLIFERGDQRLVAGGYQPLAVYDLCVANLDTTLDCRPGPSEVAELLRELPYGLTTREVALAMAERNDEPDDAAATEALARGWWQAARRSASSWATMRSGAPPRWPPARRPDLLRS